MRRRLRRSAAVMFYGAVVVVCWPRVRCGWCGRMVWGWSYTSHTFDHFRAHWRDLHEAYQDGAS